MRNCYSVPSPYGRFTANGGAVRACRFLWTTHHGPLPPQVVVMHQTCDEPSCTRLDHLRPGSQAENLASAASRAPRRGGGTPAGPSGEGWPAGPGHPGRPGRRLPQRLQAALAAGDPRADWAVLF